MSKRLICVLIVGLLICTQGALAATKVKVVSDGQLITKDALIIKGRVYLPISAVKKVFGVGAQYDKKTGLTLIMPDKSKRTISGYKIIKGRSYISMGSIKVLFPVKATYNKKAKKLFLASLKPKAPEVVAEEELPPVPPVEGAPEKVGKEMLPPSPPVVEEAPEVVEEEAPILLTRAKKVITLEEITRRLERINRKIQDMTMVLEMGILDKKGKIAMSYLNTLYHKGDKVRMEMEIKTGKTIILFDGQDFYMKAPLLGTQKIPADKLEPEQRPTQVWYKMFLPPEGKIAKEKVIEGVKIYGRKAGRTAVCIEIPEGKGPFTEVWVDKAELLVLMARSKTLRGQMTTTYDDYRKVSGFPFPYDTVSFLDEKPFSRTKVKSIKINTGLSDDLFKL